MPSGRSTSCIALAAEPVRQHANGTYIPSMLSKQTGKAIVAYVKYKYSRTVGLQYMSCYVALILGLLTIAYIIMTVRVFIRNIAGGDSSMYYCNVYYIWRPRLPIRPCDERPPAMYGHFCLVPRVSVHDRYYCSRQFGQSSGLILLRCSSVSDDIAV